MVREEEDPTKRKPGKVNEQAKRDCWKMKSLSAWKHFLEKDYPKMTPKLDALKTKCPSAHKKFIDNEVPKISECLSRANPSLSSDDLYRIGFQIAAKVLTKYADQSAIGEGSEEPPPKCPYKEDSSIQEKVSEKGKQEEATGKDRTGIAAATEDSEKKQAADPENHSQAADLGGTAEGAEGITGISAATETSEEKQAAHAGPHSLEKDEKPVVCSSFSHFLEEKRDELYKKNQSKHPSKSQDELWKMVVREAEGMFDALPESDIKKYRAIRMEEITVYEQYMTRKVFERRNKMEKNKYERLPKSICVFRENDQTCQEILEERISPQLFSGLEGKTRQEGAGLLLCVGASLRSELDMKEFTNTVVWGHCHPHTNSNTVGSHLMKPALETCTGLTFELVNIDLEPTEGGSSVWTKLKEDKKVFDTILVNSGMFSDDVNRHDPVELLKMIHKQELLANIGTEDAHCGRVPKIVVPVTKSNSGHDAVKRLFSEEGLKRLEGHFEYRIIDKKEHMDQYSILGFNGYENVEFKFMDWFWEGTKVEKVLVVWPFHKSLDRAGGKDDDHRKIVGMLDLNTEPDEAKVSELICQSHGDSSIMSDRDDFPICLPMMWNKQRILRRDMSLTDIVPSVRNNVLNAIVFHWNCRMFQEAHLSSDSPVMYMFTEGCYQSESRPLNRLDIEKIVAGSGILPFLRSTNLTPDRIGAFFLPDRHGGFYRFDGDKTVKHYSPEGGGDDGDREREQTWSDAVFTALKIFKQGRKLGADETVQVESMKYDTAPEPLTEVENVGKEGGMPVYNAVFTALKILKDRSCMSVYHMCREVHRELKPNIDAVVPFLKTYDKFVLACKKFPLQMHVAQREIFMRKIADSIADPTGNLAGWDIMFQPPCRDCSPIYLPQGENMNYFLKNDEMVEEYPVRTMVATLFHAHGHPKNYHFFVDSGFDEKDAWKALKAKISNTHKSTLLCILRDREVGHFVFCQIKINPKKRGKKSRRGKRSFEVSIRCNIHGDKIESEDDKEYEHYKDRVTYLLKEGLGYDDFEPNRKGVFEPKTPFWHCVGKDPAESKHTHGENSCAI